MLFEGPAVMVAIDSVGVKDKDQVSKNHDSGEIKVTLQSAQGTYFFADNAIQSFNVTIDGTNHDAGAAAYAFTDSLNADFGRSVWG